MKKIDTVLEMYSTLEENKIKAYHQYKKTDDINILKEATKDFIDETIEFRKVVIGENFLPFKLLEAKRNLKQCDDPTVIENFILKVTNENLTIKNDAINDLKRKYVINDDYGVIECYVSLSNTIIDDKLSYMCEESSYIIECLENMKIVTEAEAEVKGSGDNNTNTNNNDSNENKTKKVGAGIKKIANTVLQKIKEFLKKIKNIFKEKVTKLRERDLKWLNENKKAILNAKVDDLEVNVHNDYNETLQTMADRANKFDNAFAGMRLEDSSLASKIEEKEKQYSDKNGDLRQGLMNYYRTGDPKKEKTVVTLRGSQIKGALNRMHDYCIDFLGSYNNNIRLVNDIERRITAHEKEMARRNITEGFCLVEDDYIQNTDLALCENFHALLENEQKVGVSKRNVENEEAKGRSDKELSNNTKHLRDQQLGCSTFLTTAEAKYFELIKILRSIA